MSFINKLVLWGHDPATLDTLKQIYFIDGDKPKKPCLNYAVAQPGAGKSTLMNGLSAQFPSGEAAALINVDSLRKHHPMYRNCGHDPFAMNRITGKETHAWYRTLIVDAITSRINISVEGGITSPFQFGVAGRALKAAGYDIDVHFLAVHWRESFLCIVERFENRLDSGQQARWVCLSKHAKACEAALPMIQGTEQNGAWRSITVYRRGQVPQCFQPQDLKHRAASKAVAAEFMKKWTPAAQELHAHRAHVLYDKVSSRKTTNPRWYCSLLGEFARQSEQLAKGETAPLSLGSLAVLTQIEQERHRIEPMVPRVKRWMNPVLALNKDRPLT